MYNNGVYISQLKLQDDLNVSDSTAWRLLYKFRAMECEADADYRNNVIKYIRSCLRVNPLLKKKDGILTFPPIRYARATKNPYIGRRTREEIEQEKEILLSKGDKNFNPWKRFTKWLSKLF